MSPEGDWVLGAEVPLEEPLRGLRRLARFLADALGECFATVDTPPDRIPVLICLAEQDRTGRISDLESQLTRSLVAILGHELHAASGMYAFGQVGGAVALRDARRLLGEGAEHVIVAGADSFLSARTLNDLFESGRVLSPTNSNGFLPGEAGAAVLISPNGPGLALSGLGFAHEPAHISSGQPLRGDGMVAAMRQALDEAELDYEAISYRIADLDGEQYYFREATLAQIRLWRGGGNPEEVWMPCDGMGQTGAAVIPICLGLGLTAWQKDYAPGPDVLIHAAHDDGRRAAIVLRGEVSHGQ